MNKRFNYRLNFTVKSPLHVGSGMTRIENDETEGEFEVATICRDVSGNPWIPGSTLKGAFRAHCGEKDVELFGASHGMEDELVGGALRISGGRSSATGKSIFVRKHTRIHSGTGTSMAHLLFAREYVETATEFTADVVLQSDCSNELKGAFERTLGEFTVEQGVPFGAGKSDHLGALVLKSVKRSESTLTEKGWREAEAETLELAPPDAEPPLAQVRLQCPGLYLSKSGEEVDSDDNKTTVADKDGNDLPRILTTGVSGVLRARAEWLMQIAERRGDPWSEEVECRTSSGMRRLGVVKRLFGDEGYRGRLNVRVDDVSAKRDQLPNGVARRRPHLALDPVSQAPFSSALFFIAAHHDVSFNLTFSSFGGRMRADEEQLLGALKKDIEAHGLKLGMGTAKGYGWFNCGPTNGNDDIGASNNTETLASLEISNKVTLPYRFAEADLNNVGMPEPQVASAHRALTLHSHPLNHSNSGYLDVSWCFETPMLIGNGEDPVSPQKIGERYVIPGSTVRGNVRAGVEAAVNARLARINEEKLSPKDPRSGFAFETVQARLLRVDNGAAPNPHRPQLNAEFVPDFAAALFGFVGLGDSREALPPELHQHLHLRSRVGFGTAWLISEHDKNRAQDTYKPYRASPDAKAVFYDHAGRKQYLATQATPEDVINRLNGARTNNQNQPTLKFLHPLPGKTLVFRERISFHNLTDVELGALIWVLHLNMLTARRHRLGHAKAFGAGRAIARDVHLHFTHDHLGTREAARDLEKEHLGYTGESGWRFWQVFKEYLTQLPKEFDRGRAEYLEAATPAVGQAIRREGNVSNNDVGYQTARTLPRVDRKEARTKNDGRLAALLVKAPER